MQLDSWMIPGNPSNYCGPARSLNHCYEYIDKTPSSGTLNAGTPLCCLRVPGESSKELWPLRVFVGINAGHPGGLGWEKGRVAGSA